MMTTQIRNNSGDESGFTLIETTIAMIIILVAMLGVAFSLTYAINYNSGNASRAKSLAVLQQEVERMRSAKFTPAYTDPLLAGGTSVRTVSSLGSDFTVTTVVDNDPFTAGVQDETVFTSMKEITISARLTRQAQVGKTR